MLQLELDNFYHSKESAEENSLHHYGSELSEAGRVELSFEFNAKPPLFVEAVVNRELGAANCVVEVENMLINVDWTNEKQAAAGCSVFITRKYGGTTEYAQVWLIYDPFHSLPP